MKNQKHNAATTKVQVSAHKLLIERGRYTKPLSPVPERICKTYIGNKVEDEYLLLSVCDKYKIQCNLLTNNIYKLQAIPTFWQLIKIGLFSARIETVKYYVAKLIDKHLP